MSFQAQLGRERERESAEMLDLWRKAPYQAVPKPEAFPDLIYYDATVN